MHTKIILSVLLSVGSLAAMSNAKKARLTEADKENRIAFFLEQHEEFEKEDIIAFEVNDKGIGTITTSKDRVRKWDALTGLEFKKF